ncbi:putative cyclic nucleotide-gated ion channel 5 [Drosera capensis]
MGKTSGGHGGAEEDTGDGRIWAAGARAVVLGLCWPIRPVFLRNLGRCPGQAAARRRGIVVHAEGGRIRPRLGLGSRRRAPGRVDLVGKGRWKIAGALWYLFSVERIEACWRQACSQEGGNCSGDCLSCNNAFVLTETYQAWSNMSQAVLGKMCFLEDPGSLFDFGIYTTSNIVANC